MRRLYPRGARPEDVPPDADGISLDEWRRRQTYEDLVDPVRARDDLARARAEQEKRLAAKRGKRR